MEELKRGLMDELYFGLIEELYFGLIDELYFGLIDELYFGLIDELYFGLIEELYLGLIAELNFGLIVALNFGFSAALYLGFRLVGIWMAADKPAGATATTKPKIKERTRKEVKLLVRFISSFLGACGPSFVFRKAVSSLTFNTTPIRSR